MVITEEMIISGFISKIVSDVVDISENPIKKAIKDADKKRRDKNQSIETRIYQVTVDAIKEFTKREYKGQDVLYDAAESIIRGFKNSNNNVEAVRMGLKMLVSQVTSETCEDFLKTLHHEICIDRNDILYKQITLIQGKQTIETVREGFDVSSRNDEETHEKLNHVIEGIDNINEKINGTDKCETKHNEIPIINRADEYAKRWDENVFLNDFNEEDENAGINIKLREIYVKKCLPHYIWGLNTQSSDQLKSYLTKYINNDKKKMLLILGQPGIGKSTLITWIIVKLVEKKENILVYQFASDLSSVNWNGDNLLEEIFAAIGLEYSELEGKTLILDGFDEIRINGDRERILHKLNQELEKKNYLNRISLLITCRENYVKKAWLEGFAYITLQTWDEEQIRSFCEIYEKVIMRNDSESIANRNLEVKVSKIIEKKEIMGIPLILYMVLALDVDIERSSSIVDIYDQIFSLKRGGIYDRRYDAEHRINDPETKKHIHHISQRIAFWMFENNADKAIIAQEKFEEICENEMKEAGQKDEGIKSDTLIGNFFKLKHCEGKGTSEIQFVHRSIYEYFTVTYFFESIYGLKDIEAVAGKLGELLKDGQLSEQMLELIKYKFNNMSEYNFADITRKVFNIMLKDGMTYYSIKEQKEPFNNVIEREKNIFLNMLKVVGLWNLSFGKLSNRIIIYLQCNRQNNLDLRGIELGLKKQDTIQEPNLVLKEMFIRKENLLIANLRRSYLRGANLSEAYLSGVDLSEANLSGANLSGANLNRVNLSRADLSGADLSGVNLGTTNLFGANLSGTILD